MIRNSKQFCKLWQEGPSLPKPRVEGPVMRLTKISSYSTAIGALISIGY